MKIVLQELIAMILSVIVVVLIVVLITTPADGDRSHVDDCETAGGRWVAASPAFDKPDVSRADRGCQFDAERTTSR